MALGGLAPLPLPLRAHDLEGLSAAQHARLAADLSALVRTAPFAVLRGNSNSTTIDSYISQVSLALADPPTVVINSPGDVTITWTRSYTDDYEGQHPVAFRWVEVSICGTGVFAEAFASAEIVSPHIVRVRTWNRGGALSLRPFVLVVY